MLADLNTTYLPDCKVFNKEEDFELHVKTALLATLFASQGMSHHLSLT